MFCIAVKEEVKINGRFILPTPYTLEYYMEHHQTLDVRTYRKIWLEKTAPLATLSDQLMQNLVCKRVLRMDHSLKITKKMKKFGPKGRKEAILDGKMLLSCLNEAGQVLGRVLTRSENNQQVQELLVQKIMPRFCDQHFDEKIVVVSDNANAVRNMISQVSGNMFDTKQDVWHVIHRFSEKINSKSMRKKICSELSDAIYHEDGQLREPSEMVKAVESVLKKVNESMLNCSLAIWEGCISNNIQQIERGDLYIKNNFYVENGAHTKIVSTSQVEGLHSQLKRLIHRSVSTKVGLRILDIFLLQVSTC
jgi:hypothetical protein